MCSVIAKFKFDLEETIMKKILAIVIAMVMVLSLSVSVFAEEIVVFNNPEGEAFSDLLNPWDFYGIGGFWGRAAANVLDITIDEVKEIASAGGATFTMVFTGTEYGDSAPNLTFDFSDPQAAAQFVVTDNGDGTYTATAAFDDLVAAWEANGKTIDDIQNLLVQPNFSDFKLISATISTGEDAVEVTPVEDETPAEETPAEETPAETGIVLAVLPMAVAAAAAVVAKKRK